jgi:hypothetical protein
MRPACIGRFAARVLRIRAEGTSGFGVAVASLFVLSSGRRVSPTRRGLPEGRPGFRGQGSSR